MKKVTVEESVRNQAASAEMEGFRFTEEQLKNMIECFEAKMSTKDFARRIAEEILNR